MKVEQYTWQFLHGCKFFWIIGIVLLSFAPEAHQWRIQKFWKGGAEDNLSAPSSFIANVHNKIYAFYTEKSGFLEKYEPIGGGCPHPLFEFASEADHFMSHHELRSHRGPVLIPYSGTGRNLHLYVCVMSSC